MNGADPSSRAALRIKTYWRKAGGGSLLLSLVIHATAFVVAAMIATKLVEQRSPIDFLPGGGSKSGSAASADLAQQVKVRKRSLLNRALPARKVVAIQVMNSIALPDQFDAREMPRLFSPLGAGGKSGGFGDRGANGGFGKGIGIGGMSAIAFGKAGRVAAILDVSRSMSPHLERVIKELNRVAKGSPTVLYQGCGVCVPALEGHIDETARETRLNHKTFENFWRWMHRAGQFGDPRPIPDAAIFTALQNRPHTYFIRFQGIKHAWISLLIFEVRDAESLYWFSDFKDPVEDRQLEAVLANLKRRKQRLFIHAAEEGVSFKAVRDKLALPSGGAVIENRD